MNFAPPFVFYLPACCCAFFSPSLEEAPGLGAVAPAARGRLPAPGPHPRGVLPHGPPGSSKTSLALASANAAKATLYSLRYTGGTPTAQVHVHGTQFGCGLDMVVTDG